jgi:hypothetical protein
MLFWGRNWSPDGVKNVLFSTEFRHAWRPTQPPSQRASEIPSSEKNVAPYIHFPLRLHGAVPRAINWIGWKAEVLKLSQFHRQLNLLILKKKIKLAYEIICLLCIHIPLYSYRGLVLSSSQKSFHYSHSHDIAFCNAHRAFWVSGKGTKRSERRSSETATNCDRIVCSQFLFQIISST